MCLILHPHLDRRSHVTGVLGSPEGKETQGERQQVPPELKEASHEPPSFTAYTEGHPRLL